MSQISKIELGRRTQIAAGLISHRRELAQEVISEFLVRHPDWQTRYGATAGQRGIEDFTYDVESLAAAVHAGRVDAFEDYVAWTTRVLAARDITPEVAVESLELLADAVRQQLPVSDADVVDLFVRGGAKRCLQEDIKASSGRLQETAQIYLDALLSGNRQRALNLILDEARQGRSVIDLYADVIQEAMYEIGRQWEENKITVAQEHMATVISQFVVANVYPLISGSKTPRGRVLITGVPGEFHQLGANMVADALESSGWDVRFLGTNTPVPAVLDAIEEHKADVLGISTTMLFNLSGVLALAESVRQRFGNRVHIVVGGAAFRFAPLLCEDIGVSGCALDLRSAIRLVDSLQPRSS